MSPALSITNLTFGHQPGQPLLERVHLSLQPRDRCILRGSIGSGKSTLLHLAIGLRKPWQGVIRIFDTPLDSPPNLRLARRRAGFLFQEPDDQLFCASVSEDIAFGPLNLGWDRATVHQAVRQTLDRLDISHLENALTHRLSGGEKRLVALAGILAMEPDLLLLDEPTNHLDDQARDKVVNVLRQSSCAMLIATHDPTLAEALSARSLTLNEQTLHERPAPPP